MVVMLAMGKAGPVAVARPAAARVSWLGPSASVLPLLAHMSMTGTALSSICTPLAVVEASVMKRKVAEEEEDTTSGGRKGAPVPEIVGSSRLAAYEEPSYTSTQSSLTWVLTA